MWQKLGGAGHEAYNKLPVSDLACPISELSGWLLLRNLNTTGYYTQTVLWKLDKRLTCHGPLTRYVKLWVVHARECWERFPGHRLRRKPLGNDICMHHGTSGSLTRGGRDDVPPSLRMRNPQFNASGKRPLALKPSYLHCVQERASFWSKWSLDDMGYYITWLNIVRLFCGLFDCDIIYSTAMKATEF